MKVDVRTENDAVFRFNVDPEFLVLRTQLEASWATLSFPFAGELEGALADWLGEGLVRRDGGETFARGLALGSQTVDQTQRLSLGGPACFCLDWRDR